MQPLGWDALRGGHGLFGEQHVGQEQVPGRAPLLSAAGGARSRRFPAPRCPALAGGCGTPRSGPGRAALPRAASRGRLAVPALPF